MYVTHRALERVGGFDTERAGTADGRALDWCMRARKLGFVHLLDDATYVYHERSAQPDAAPPYPRTPDDLAPDEARIIADYYERNPLRPLHDYIAAALRLHAAAHELAPSRTPRPTSAAERA
jgi:hypothetical protein